MRGQNPPHCLLICRRLRVQCSVNSAMAAKQQVLLIAQLELNEHLFFFFWAVFVFILSEIEQANKTIIREEGVVLYSKEDNSSTLHKGITYITLLRPSSPGKIRYVE